MNRKEVAEEVLDIASRAGRLRPSEAESIRLLLESALHVEFVRGYERGKSDERDAKEIDKSLAE